MICLLRCTEGLKGTGRCAHPRTLNIIGPRSVRLHRANFCYAPITRRELSVVTHKVPVHRQLRESKEREREREGEQREREGEQREREGVCIWYMFDLVRFPQRSSDWVIYGLHVGRFKAWVWVGLLMWPVSVQGACVCYEEHATS